MEENDEEFFFRPIVEINISWWRPRIFNLLGKIDLPNPMHIEDGFISTRHRVDQQKLSAKVMRCVASVCETTRIDVFWPRMEVRSSRRSNVWIGRHAADWCRQQSERMLALRHLIEGGPIGVLPADLVATRCRPASAARDLRSDGGMKPER
jgi:hypothetical protein